MKPLVCFVTFNNMAITVTSMTKLLKCNSDFDLIICDNDSKDLSWEYIKSLSDSRIIEKKRFQRNYGVINAANYAISKRKTGQDFCLVENDAVLVTLDQPFEKMRTVIDDCNLAGVHAGRGISDAAYLSGFRKEKGHRVKRTGIIGMFFRIRSEVMDELGFYDEVSFMADIDLRIRVARTKFKFLAYTDDVLLDPMFEDDRIDLVNTCDICKGHQRVCRPNKQADRPCLLKGMQLHKKFYEKFLEKYRAGSRSKEMTAAMRLKETLDARIKLREEINANPILYRGSIHAGTLRSSHKYVRDWNCRFFADSYEKYIKEIKFIERLKQARVRK